MGRGQSFPGYILTGILIVAVIIIAVLVIATLRSPPGGSGAGGYQQTPNNGQPGIDSGTITIGSDEPMNLSQLPQEKFYFNDTVEWGRYFPDLYDGGIVVDPRQLIRVVLVEGDYAYVGGSFFSILDISDIRNPKEIFFDQTRDEYRVNETTREMIIVPRDESYSDPKSMALNGNILYYGQQGSDTALKVIDVSDRTSPKIVNNIRVYRSPIQFVKLVIRGNLLYVAYSTAIVIFDISNPTEPTNIGTLELLYNVMGLAVKGDYAYVSTLNKGIVTVDISDPTNPTKISESGRGYYGVDVQGNYLYAANWGKGMAVFDISDPAHPTQVAECYTGTTPISIHVDGNYAFLGINKPPERLNSEYHYLNTSLTYELVNVVDISDPLNPKKVASFESNTKRPGVLESPNIAYSNGYILSPQNKEGLFFYKFPN